MKIALITDTHAGARGDSLDFADYFKRFYDDIFFATLREQGINTVIHLGDMFDRRKYVNFVTAKRLHDDFISKCSEYNIDLHVIVGNHDCYYKNTNECNALKIMYQYSDYLTWYEEPKEVEFDGTKILMMPWINQSNYDQCMDAIENATADIMMGHLEIQGFEMYKGSVTHHGTSMDTFKKFDMVMSGHFHHKSTRNNIHYLGSAFEMTWSDYDDSRGFHIFDTDKKDLTYVINPYKMFVKIFYDDSVEVTGDYAHISGTFVKVIVQNKSDPYAFDLFIDKLNRHNPLQLQIVDDNLNLDAVADDEILDEAEDLLTTINRYITNLDVEETTSIETLFRDLYTEALNME
jgi:DNA repair exonuclease SbcCD nuclease subunit